MNIEKYVIIWLSRSIFRLSPLNLKKKIRDIEKLEVKLINKKSHLEFNSFCKNYYLHICLQIT